MRHTTPAGSRGRSLAAGVLVAATLVGTACTGAPDRPGADVAGTPGPAAGVPGELRMPRAEPPDACVTRTVEAMTPHERAGQLLLVGVDADGPGQAADVVAEHAVAGVFLRGRSGRAPADLRRRIAAVQDAAPPLDRPAAGAGAPDLFVAVDQEGGAVRTLRGPGFTDIPAADRQAAMPVGDVARLSDRWAGELADAGVNLDLAPVADTVPAGEEEANPPIGLHGRQYGSDPDRVGPRVAAVSAALLGRGVLPTVKHFPGLGRVRVNTDLERGAIDRVAHGSDPHLAPFAAGVRAGAVVMMSSATYPKLDRRPAVFSPAVIQDLLRTSLGYDGLVMTDDVALAAAVRDVPVWRRAVDFVAAGGDLVLTVRAEYAAPMIAALRFRAAQDPLFAERVEESAMRVLRAKRSVGLLTC